jgi:hypothetical protein
MTREEFHREMGDAFDSISGSPDPALAERVRAALIEAPEHRGPVLAAALAAAVIAVILVGILLIVNPLNRPPALSHGGPFPTVVPSASPSPTAAPCLVDPLTLTTETAPPLGFIDAVRTGTHTGYDRVTIEFQSGTTGTIQVIPQPSTKFMTDPKGDIVSVAGKYGLLIKITGADNHTSFTGSTDIKSPTFPGMKEARLIGDFEGKVQWAVGLTASACYRAVMMQSPTRLVIDIPTN